MTRQAHLFVAVMGASSLSYAQARWSETLPDWIECHVQALEFFGGAPALLVPDNAKVAIIKACHFDPQVNRTYSAMAAHYGSAVLPTRPRRPRDKAKVEAAVRIVERWLLGRLRLAPSTISPRSTRRSPTCCMISTTGGSFAGSASRAANYSKSLTGLL
jgi:transposase